MVNLRMQEKESAVKTGAQDAAAGKPEAPDKYGAMPHSAWAEWYRDGYRNYTDKERTP